MRLLPLRLVQIVGQYYTEQMIHWIKYERTCENEHYAMSIKCVLSSLRTDK